MFKMVRLTDIFDQVVKIFEIKEAPKRPINPRYRAYGKARLDIASRAHTQDEWDQLWKPPANPFPFIWGSGWKECIEYSVKDFPTEIGFFTDFLGFDVNIISLDYAQFTSPDGIFYIGITLAKEDMDVTPPNSFRLQFKLSNLIEACHSLKKRGVSFDRNPQPIQDKSTICYASFRTPHGVPMDLWGEVSVDSQIKNGIIVEPRESLDDYNEEDDVDSVETALDKENSLSEIPTL